LQSCLVRRFDDLCYDLTTPVPNTEHGYLADRTPTGVQFLIGVLVLFKPSNVGFVTFDNTGQEFIQLVC
jgi:hypothetical protein